MFLVVKGLWSVSFLVDLFPSFCNFVDVISSARPNMENKKQWAERILEWIIKEHNEEKQEEKTRKSRETEDLVDVLLKFHNNSDNGLSLTSDNVKAIIWVSAIFNFCWVKLLCICLFSLKKLKWGTCMGFIFLEGINLVALLQIYFDGSFTLSSFIRKNTYPPCKWIYIWTFLKL